MHCIVLTRYLCFLWALFWKQSMQRTQVGSIPQSLKAKKILSIQHPLTVLKLWLQWSYSGSTQGSGIRLRPSPSYKPARVSRFSQFENFAAQLRWMVPLFQLPKDHIWVSIAEKNLQRTEQEPLSLALLASRVHIHASTVHGRHVLRPYSSQHLVQFSILQRLCQFLQRWKGNILPLLLDLKQSLLT